MSLQVVETAVVKATAGFPDSRKFDIDGDWASLTLKTVSGWAKQHTNLHEYIGWRFCKFNAHPVANEQEFEAAVASMSPGDPIVFTMSILRSKVNNLT
jgi:hypothetical protein